MVVAEIFITIRIVIKIYGIALLSSEMFGVFGY